MALTAAALEVVRSHRAVRERVGRAVTSRPTALAGGVEAAARARVVAVTVAAARAVARAAAAMVEAGLARVVGMEGVASSQSQECICP